MKLNSKKGFTLIELMVVVGIIGVISMIAIPNFQRFQSKAKQANAKTELASIYGMEKAFFTEFGQYHSNLIMIGYSPDGVPLDADGCVGDVDATWPTRYYMTGFSGGTATGSLAGLAEPCAALTNMTIAATVKDRDDADLSIEDGNDGNTNDFQVGSTGNIGGRRLDLWHINQNKLLTNNQPGF